MQIIEPYTNCPLCLQGMTGRLSKILVEKGLKFLHTGLIQELKEEWV